MKAAIAFVAGLLFGAGLVVSGMTSPDRVLGFLDIAGAWDPSLAFVMGGAVLTAAPLFALSRRWKGPLTGGSYATPPRTLIDARLLGGAALFGAGWGVAGMCPGPAVVDLVVAPGKVAMFVAAMLVGLWASRKLGPRS